ncbi:MAG TPA: tetratricopeptide repeat protein [Gemmatimonadales bacterium]|nr:tetratricopeptide repeat protein [Gemmatimonadales bacterium]
MSKLEQLKDKAKGLEAKDPKRAIEAWVEVLKSQEAENDPSADLSIYNRVGDLYLKLKDPALAADYYDRAVDRYAEQGFHNNAIAMCNKVLRNAPARESTYLKLAKLYAAKGFIAEAKQNFVEYAQRMKQTGNIQHAFAALKEFTDISPESENLREMLEEHLKMYGEARRPSARVSVPKSTLPPKQATPKRKTSSLVFIDVDAPAAPKEKPKVGGAPMPPKAAPPAPAEAPPPASLVEEPTPEPDTSLEIESTSLVEEEPAATGGTLDGLEVTSTDFGSVQAEAGDPPTLRDDPVADDVVALDGLEPTAEEDELTEASGVLDAEGLDLETEDVEIEIEPPPPAPPPKPQAKPAAPAAPKAPPPKAPAPPAPKAPAPPKAPAAPPLVVKPVTPKRPAPPPPPPPKAPEKRKTVVEVPPLELEPDFEEVTTDAAHEIDDQPLALDESASHPDWVQTEDETSIGGRKSGFIDLGLDGLTTQGDQASSLVFDNIQEDTEAPSIEDLEARVADNPDDPVAHQTLGEALIEAGERDRGIEELDLAAGAYEATDNLEQARATLDEILRLDPNSVRHRQKQVEFAFKAGDKASLIDAYLELADTLLRGDLPEKARSVYERVAEHDPKNERAKAALAMLAPTEAPEEKKVKAKDAKMKVRDEAGADGDFVDLGAMIMEDEHAERDTRMKVQDEEPTGDEEQDFKDMLSRFRQGIDENIDEADFQSHYDLGVAFKEMGLLDEAIAEFQKALRAPEGKLRTSEALGVCFYEKGAYVVAESILRRGLDLPASGDQERLGVLYWLARALEEQGKGAEARELYGRVFAVEIKFMDVGERVKALAKAK